MDEEVKQRIFEPFYTTKGPGKGTGLGLALVYSIIQNHRGMIEVESELNVGTTFSIYFPIDDHKTVNGPDEALKIEDLPNGNETILVIEDEELLVDLITTILVSKGYKVLSAADGEEGVAIFRKQKDEIAAIVTDLGLPKLSGDEVIMKIKSIDPTSKIILSSGFLDAEGKAALLATGAERFLMKPYKPVEVLQTVREIIDGKGQT